MKPLDTIRRTRGTVRLAPGLQQTVRTAALRGLVPRQVWNRLHPTGTWTLHDPDGIPFLYHAAREDLMARCVVWTDLRHWEETTQPVLFELARTARGFLDVGAFSGIYTLLACQANPELRVVAMEPNPHTIGMLRRNVEINGLGDRVTLVQKALSDGPGRARLAIPYDTTAASLNAATVPVRSVEVEVSTADEVVGDQPIDLVKIDVEGLEPEVLHGMTRTIAAHRPAIIAECLDAPALERLRATADALGYRTVQHLGRTGLSPAGEGFVPPPFYANFLLTP
ncbi:FkbM family methyltransferase [Streptomyces sp. NBC_01465]|uniref:FkbM family methyltransferase n=1 Tax=Streptomyces sp. NBC_01465 TaxID=2903878 RepID=UPI002E36A735|nr:FkbM family methyltransferase [Streptomyces sp. NBC_01465]